MRHQKKGINGVPLAVRMTDPGTPRGCRLVITMRPQNFPGLAWLKQDTKVSIKVGNGADHGRLRIVPGGPYKLMATGGRKACAVFLSLRPLPGTRQQRHEVEAPEFDYQDGWIDITLPDWAHAPAPVTAPAGGDPAAGAPSRRFVGALDGVSHAEAATRRGGATVPASRQSR